VSDTQATTLFSLATVKAYVKVPTSTYDAQIIAIADAVSQRIEAITRRVFVERSLIETHDGDGSRRLRLRKFPVVGAVTSLTVKDTPDGTPVVLVAGTDFDTDVRLGLIRLRSRCFTQGFQNVVVTYTAGWDVKDGAALPQDVYQAGLDYVKAVWNEWQNDAISATSVSVGPAQLVVKAGLAPGIKSVLDSWRAVRL
jgi:hypothetical protein